MQNWICFSIFKLNFWGQKSIPSLWKVYSYLNVYIGKQLLFVTFLISMILTKLCLNKLCGIFLQLGLKHPHNYKITLSVWNFNTLFPFMNVTKQPKQAWYDELLSRCWRVNNDVFTIKRKKYPEDEFSQSVNVMHCIMVN